MPIEGLPDNLKGNEALAAFNSPEDLANAYLTSKDWRSGLPDELKTEKSIETFKDVGSLAKSYVEAQKMIGGSIRIPKKDLPPEEAQKAKGELLAKLQAEGIIEAVPGKPEEYAFGKPTNLPDGVSWNENLVKWFSNAAHKAGLSKTQAAALLSEWNENAFSEYHATQKTMGEKIGKLRQEWGEKFDGNVELGLRGIERLLSSQEAQEFKELMDTTGLGNHPLMIKFAYLAGKMLKEDGYIMDDGKGGAVGVAAAKAKIEAIQNDPKHPFWNDGPGHKEAVEEWTRLHKIAYN